MTWIVRNLWLIPAMPLLAAGMSALAKQRTRRFAASVAIGSMLSSFLLSLAAFLHVLGRISLGIEARQVFNFPWFQLGDEWLKLGWMLDPLASVMLVMVTFVGLLIFIYSVGYMSHDENFTRFFCFLSLFAGAMLGVVIANSLLLLFMCWELVGLTSYLLIGFWYKKPAAAAVLFFNGGAGSMEAGALAILLAQPAALGLTAAGAIGLLIFCGAAGKSGVLPLHGGPPDALGGPPPGAEG